VAEACDEWLAGRRGIRSVTLQGYTHDLKAVRRFLGGKKLQQLSKADGDALVDWMLTEGRSPRKRHRPGSLAGRVAELIETHPEGISAADVAAAFPGEDVHTGLAGLLRASRVTRLRRGIYAPNEPNADRSSARGVKPVTVRSTLTTFGMVVQSFVNQGLLTRNVIALVERPADDLIDDKPETSKSWALAEVEHFRASVREDRLFACWLLSCYGLRRSEVLGIRWLALEGDTLSIRRSRVAVGKDSVEGMPKSRRSLRDLPLPAELAAALQDLKARQQDEARAFGSRWSDDRLVAVREDGSPIRHEWYSDEFQRMRERAGLRRIHLKGLRNTSVSLMLPAVCRCTSSRPGTAMIRRCHCRSTPTPSARICAQPAPHSSADAWSTESRLGHCWDTGSNSQQTVETENPLRHWSERVFLRRADRI
jgi:site-specific recombinase XerC